MNLQHHTDTPPPAEIMTPGEHTIQERREIPAGGPPPDEGLASQFLAAELAHARAALQRTWLIGAVVLLLVGGELLWIANHFEQSLRPHAAAEIAEGVVAQQVQEKGPEIASQLKEKIPEFLAQTPDYILHELPTYRQTLADRVEAQLNQYCQQTSQQLGRHLDSYLDTHKDQIKTILASGNDPATVQQLGASLKQELLSYLQEKPQNGESISDQINSSLASLEEIQKKTQRLATAKDLTVAELKARRAIGILAHSIDTHGQQIHQQIHQQMQPSL